MVRLLALCALTGSVAACGDSMTGADGAVGDATAGDTGTTTVTDGGRDGGRPGDAGRDTGATGGDTGMMTDTDGGPVEIDGGGSDANLPRCGNGTIDGSDVCDDGNTTADDGCSATCTVEDGFDCTTASPSVCTTECGDGITAGTETCDDGNTTADDGCSATCGDEAGWSCDETMVPSVCTATCGDGVIVAGEDCDDGDMASNDGCSMGCDVEAGYACAGAPSVCTLLCGNGTVDAGETCDDMNTVATDGCNACVLTAGYTCSGTPQTCAATCGDGITVGTEECDDGNNLIGDGCSRCELEGSLDEVEPNEDGTPSTGGSTANGNDFGSANADLNGAYTVDFIVHAALSVPGLDGGAATAGDEDVFAVRNAGTTAAVWSFVTSAVGDLNACTFDTVITLRDAAGTMLTRMDGATTVNARDDDGGVGSCSLLSWSIAPGQTVYVHITEYGDDGVIPAYQLTGSVCQSNLRTPAEVCDDGNAVDGDGCDSNCTATGCGNAIVTTGETCDDGNASNTDTCTVMCRAPACGDGYLQSGETCDDMNVVANDGCSGTCAVESGFNCTNASGVLSTCTAQAGNSTCAGATAISANGTLTGQNLAAGQAGFTGTSCSSSNTNLTLFYSVSVPVGQRASFAVLPSAANPFDIVMTSKDTCDALVCGTQTDVGSSGAGEVVTIDNTIGVAAVNRVFGVRSTSASTRSTFDFRAAYGAACGNSIRESAEGCDDGNAVAGDGCSATCTVESGFTCPTGVFGGACRAVGTFSTIATAACVDVSAQTALVVSSADDAVSAETALPFAFTLVGDAMTRYRVDTNGVLYLGSATVATPSSYTASNAAISATSPNGFVAPFWDDLVMGGTSGGLRTLTTGTAPNRVLVVEWNGYRYNTTTNTVRMQAHLHETTNVVEFHYCAIANSWGNGTIGVENLAGGGISTGATAAPNTTNAGLSGTGFRFTPAP